MLALLMQRGLPVALSGVDRLIAACAMGDTTSARAIAAAEPALVDQLKTMGGPLLARFAGTDNAPGVACLLELGVDVAAPFSEGDGYFDITPRSLAIHVAAWRGRPTVVKLLISRGSPVDLPDSKGRTPLALAVKACVDSYWTERRSPQSVQALLDAGARVSGARYPSGYAEVDQLLEAHGGQ